MYFRTIFDRKRASNAAYGVESWAARGDAVTTG
jgi:hypothetical protein